MLLVDRADRGLTILPTHRLLHDFERFDPALVDRLAQRHRVIARRDRAALLAAMQEPAKGHRIGIALAPHPSPSGGGQGRGCVTVDIAPADTVDSVSRLDASVLHREILPGELGLAPAELDSRRCTTSSRTD